MSRGLINEALGYLSTEEAGTTATGGWCKLPNGTVFEWGVVNVPGPDSVVNFDLPVPVVSLETTTVQITPLDQGYTWNYNFGASTTSRINVGRRPLNSLQYGFVLVIGRWK